MSTKLGTSLKIHIIIAIVAAAKLIRLVKSANLIGEPADVELECITA